MIFETERLFVRHLRDNDLEALHVLYSDPAIMEFIRPPLTIEETKSLFDLQLENYKQEPPLGRYLIIDKMSNTFVGLFMLRRNQDKEGIEIGYSFRKQDWGKGYATEIVKKGIEFAFISIDCDVIYAITHLRNANSKKVLLKCGFTYRYDIEEDGKHANLFSIEKNSLSQPATLLK